MQVSPKIVLLIFVSGKVVLTGGKVLSAAPARLYLLTCLRNPDLELYSMACLYAKLHGRLRTSP
eukprot:6212113-Pleurochrysis_carterae.AAC.2